MWDRNSLVSVTQLSRSDIEEILSVASSFVREPRELCKGKILANIFFEPSTRTEKSFQSAMYRLGGQVLTHKDAGSSREKGETKEDTIRILAGYADIAVIRDDEEGQIMRYAALAGVPAINAGDGSNEHPTQSLLDAFTIMQEHGRLENLRIAFLGDLKYGRTVHSLMKVLSLFPGNEMYSITPSSLTLPAEMRFIEAGHYDVENMEKALNEIKPDVVYCTRVQKERLKGEKGSYIMHREILEALPTTCRVLHPLPRSNEINADMDSDPRVIPFKQARNGVPVRMAVISMMLKAKKELE
ncbi:MAG: aspartate carbamoyltransferase [Candidatus Aenigmarchaeota archaeon]|nr:aspartate carbamoyltransferase [Candidatus Aenigmarchaeota archaeon]